MEAGTAPIFGFPPICYSPPNELKKETTVDGKEAINTLIKHVFNKDNGLASVATLLSAKKEEDMLLNNLMKRFMTGKKKREGQSAEAGYRNGRQVSSQNANSASPIGKRDIWGGSGGANSSGNGFYLNQMTEGGRGGLKKNQEYGATDASGNLKPFSKGSRKPGGRKNSRGE